MKKILFLDKQEWKKAGELMRGYYSGNYITHRTLGTIGYWNKNSGEGWIYKKVK